MIISNVSYDDFFLKGVYYKLSIQFLDENKEMVFIEVRDFKLVMGIRGNEVQILVVVMEYGIINSIVWKWKNEWKSQFL